MDNIITQARTNTNKDSVVKIALETWYVRKDYPSEKNKNGESINRTGWVKFLYGDQPDKNKTIFLCANTKLVRTPNSNMSLNGKVYARFKVIGGNIFVEDGKQELNISSPNAKYVWLSESNIKTYLTKNGFKIVEAKVKVEYKKIEKNKNCLNGANEYCYTKNMQFFADLFYGSNLEHKIENITCNSHTNYMPIPSGTYKILLPDRSHSEQRAGSYLTIMPNLSDYDVWFPIEYVDPNTNKQDRYIHAGQISHGCITIHNLGKWNDLYDYLISHRASANGNYIGILTIADKTNGEYIKDIQEWKMKLMQ